ncbi:TPA: hypothetical protein IAC10_05910 [Candidatus Scatousia excrementigallinarum]|uniref:Uncharacterized protein n=1 Tax=Candidatus Scatousia excrementigallinarum TaxID=2840935 RepID=A0A9D1EYZ3_9BACT|nr:hypothetical protein [Candidatus Scatousia excrementigallinarum]
MKITSISSYRSSYNNTNSLKQSSNNKHQNVSFGFGEDYGMDPMDDSFHASNPSTLKTLKYLAELVFAAGSELLGSDKKRLREIERLGRELEMKEEFEERKRREELERNRIQDDDSDDY